jgi:hypothetical protein
MKVGDLVTNRWRAPLVGVIIDFFYVKSGDFPMTRVFWADGGTTSEFVDSIWRVNENG